MTRRKAPIIIGGGVAVAGILRKNGEVFDKRHVRRKVFEEMKASTKFLAAAIVIAALVSCKSQYDALLESNDNDAKYKAAFEYFNAGKYKKAADLFESLSVLTNGTSRDDTVQFYWGLSNYRNNDYYTAETNFVNFLGKFPLSPFAENAQFLRIDCLYKQTYRYELDQTPSYRALAAISEYKINYPGTLYAAACKRMEDDLNERLDRKAFENARIYYTMSDYKAARVALKNVLKEDSDNIYREDILYYAAMSSYKFAEKSIPSKQKERYLMFNDDYLNFIGEYPESHYRKELDGLYQKVKEKKMKLCAPSGA